MKKAIVKKENQVYKFDDIKKERFVNLYRQLFGHITDTCAGIGISRQTYYDWLEKDSAFLKQIMEAEMELNDDIRDVLIKKAGEGDMTAVIFYLKKRHPDFKDTPGLTAVQFENASQSMKLIVTRGEENE